MAQSLRQNRWLRCTFCKTKTIASYLHPASGTMFTSAKDLFRLVSFAVFQALPTHTSHNLYSVFLDLSLQWDSARLRIYSLKFQTQRKSRKTAMKLFSVLPMFLLMLSVSGNPDWQRFKKVEWIVKEDCSARKRENSIRVFQRIRSWPKKCVAVASETA